MNEIATTNENQIEILELHEQQIINQCRIQAQSFTETGKLLKAIKDGKEYSAKGFKSFSEYADAVCGTVFPFKSTQAYKYIRVYEQYGPRLEQYGTISLDILDMFKDMPADEFDKLANEKNLGSMSVKEADELRRELDKANEQISFLQSTVKEKEEALNELDKGCNSLIYKNADLEKEIQNLKSRPVDVVIKEPDEAEIEKRVKKRLEESEAEHTAAVDKLNKKIDKLQKAADKAKDYEKKLEELNSRLDSERTSSDERVKDLQKQLESASGKADEAMIEYKFYFTNIQENFKKFIGVLDKISDMEKKDKFKGAAVKFLKMTLDELERGDVNET